MQITDLAKWISVVGGAGLVSLQLASHADSALIAHLDSKFATKAEIAEVNKKVDQVLFILQHKR